MNNPVVVILPRPRKTWLYFFFSPWARETRLHNKIIHLWFSPRLKEVLSTGGGLLPDSWQQAGVSDAAVLSVLPPSSSSTLFDFLPKLKSCQTSFCGGVLVWQLKGPYLSFSIPFLRLPPLCDCEKWCTNQYLKTCRARGVPLSKEGRSYKNNANDRKYISVQLGLSMLEGGWVYTWGFECCCVWKAREDGSYGAVCPVSGYSRWSSCHTACL